VQRHGRQVTTAAFKHPGHGPRFAGQINVDHWSEEDEEVFVHPRDPFVRVDALKSSRRVRVEHEAICSPSHTLRSWFSEPVCPPADTVRPTTSALT
jgi:hypothetical protein